MSKVYKYIDKLEEKFFESEDKTTTVAKIKYRFDVYGVTDNHVNSYMLKSAFEGIINSLNIPNWNECEFEIESKVKMKPGESINPELAKKLAVSKCNKRAFRIIRRAINGLTFELGKISDKLNKYSLKLSELEDREIEFLRK